ncbi:hypothetical protein PsYK624_147130 [Phanerochaete sordida]|uniref:Uncharacterized protein n=1 Tax=Phanerochaete sordida TaxID=48140 RepID=A0A9P3GNY1_9APHY|nr:hypothetical protein PsYK624_147130 [Phanerochaete sordida]
MLTAETFLGLQDSQLGASDLGGESALMVPLFPPSPSKRARAQVYRGPEVEEADIPKTCTGARAGGREGCGGPSVFQHCGTSVLNRGRSGGGGRGGLHPWHRPPAPKVISTGTPKTLASRIAAHTALARRPTAAQPQSQILRRRGFGSAGNARSRTFSAVRVPQCCAPRTAKLDAFVRSVADIDAEDGQISLFPGSGTACTVQTCCADVCVLCMPQGLRGFRLHGRRQPRGRRRASRARVFGMGE